MDRLASGIDESMFLSCGVVRGTKRIFSRSIALSYPKSPIRCGLYHLLRGTPKHRCLVLRPCLGEVVEENASGIRFPKVTESNRLLPIDSLQLESQTKCPSFFSEQ